MALSGTGHVLPILLKNLPIMQKNSNKELKKNSILSTVDNRTEKISYKIPREARLAKLPYMLVVGAKEQENGVVSVRSRFAGDEGRKTAGRVYHSHLRRN